MSPDDAAPAANAPAVEQPSNWNIANALTMLRLLLVPVFGCLLLADGSLLWRWAALVVFIIASITDQVDGHLARKRDLVTDVGAVADPIADKLLTGVAFVGLSILGELRWWATIVILVREWGVTALRFWVIRLRRDLGQPRRQAQDHPPDRRADRLPGAGAARRSTRCSTGCCRRAGLIATVTLVTVATGRCDCVARAIRAPAQ